MTKDLLIPLRNLNEKISGKYWLLGPFPTYQITSTKAGSKARGNSEESRFKCAATCAKSILGKKADFRIVTLETHFLDYLKVANIPR